MTSARAFSDPQIPANIELDIANYQTNHAIICRADSFQLR